MPGPPKLRLVAVPGNDIFPQIKRTIPCVSAARRVVADVYRNLCHENHTGPSYTANPIGTIAGYEAFGLFLDDGGYGESQAMLDEIADLNATYQEYEYDPRQAEADAIRAWLTATHEIDDGTDSTPCTYCGEYHTMAEYEATRDAKVNRLHAIDAEIDDEWDDLVDTIRAMISDNNYEEYLDEYDLLP